MTIDIAEGASDVLAEFLGLLDNFDFDVKAVSVPHKASPASLI